MKKNSIRCLLAVILLGVLAASVSAQTTDEILEGMIEALGGREVLQKMKDMTVTGEVNLIEMGIVAKVTSSMKEPNLARVDIEMQGTVMSQIFDGERAWIVDPLTGVEEQMPGAVQKYAERDSLGFSSLLNPAKYGIEFTYTGKEEIENKEYHVLEQKFRDGSITTYHLDSETHLPFKSSGRALNSLMMEVNEETYNSDYRLIDGVNVAHRVAVYQDGKIYMTSAVTDVKVNIGLPDSLFKRGN